MRIIFIYIIFSSTFLGRLFLQKTKTKFFYSANYNQPLRKYSVYNLIQTTIEPNTMLRSLILKPSEITGRNELNHSLQFFQSETLITSRTPRNLKSSKNNEEEQQKQRSDTYQEKIQELMAIIQEHQKTKQKLKKQVSQTTNELLRATALSEELSLEKQNLYQQLKLSFQNYQKLEKQKLKLIEELFEVKNQHNIFEKRIDFLEQQNLIFEKRNIYLNEDIFFKDNLYNDLKAQNEQLKSELKKIYESLKNYEQLKKELIDIQKLNKSIKEKSQYVEKDLAQSRRRILELEYSEKNQEEQYLKLFTQLEKEKHKREELNLKLAELETTLKEKEKDMHKVSINLFNNKKKFRQTMENKNKQISEFVQSFIDLDKKNRQQRQEIDYYRRECLRYQSEKSVFKLGNFPLKSADFEKVLKTIHAELQSAKSQLFNKTQENLSLKKQMQQQLTEAISKGEEYEILLFSKEGEFRKKEEKYREQIINMQKNHWIMSHRAENFLQEHKKLREEIAEKDRIIMEYINSQKSIDP